MDSDSDPVLQGTVNGLMNVVTQQGKLIKLLTAKFEEQGKVLDSHAKKLILLQDALDNKEEESSEPATLDVSVTVGGQRFAMQSPIVTRAGTCGTPGAPTRSVKRKLPTSPLAPPPANNNNQGAGPSNVVELDE